MADGLYIGMAGMAARAEQLDSIADNLANAQTPGFKAGRPSFESFLPAGAGPDNDKVAPAAVQTGIDLSPGQTMTTGEAMDVLPEGNAFLSVQLPDGTIGYTRNGRLKPTADGFITAAGHPLMDISGEAVRTPLGARIEIDSQGQVLANEQVVGQLQLATLLGPLERRGPSVLAPAEGGMAVISQDRLNRGVVEMGNAAPMEAAVQMISAQRHYETASQALQTYKRMDERASEVGKVR